MNAQEAIEVVEQLDVFHEKNSEAIEALSIVLEFAKMLHDQIEVDWEEPEEGYGDEYALEISAVFLNKDKMRKLGIESWMVTDE